jgi:hypothetical protein
MPKEGRMFLPRWKAVVHYRADAGPVDITHDLDEIEDLHDLVEAGPHWDTILRIEITRVNHCDAADLSVENAMTL